MPLPCRIASRQGNLDDWVRLAPGGTAHVVLDITDAELVCAHPVRTTGLKVFPPGQRHAQVVGFSSRGCRGKSVMHVDSVHHGTGIPGFSAR